MKVRSASADTRTEVLAAPTGGWTFRLDAAKELDADPRTIRRCSPACDLRSAAKHEFDPGRVLGPGYEVF